MSAYEDTFIEQTAKDYDIDIEIIREVYKRNSEDFYEILEQMIEDEQCKS